MSVGSFHKQSASGGLIKVQARPEDVAFLKRMADLSPDAFAAAQRRAINKTIGWLRTHIARAVSQQERIAQRAVRQRLRSYMAKGNASWAKLWFGINPIEASRIGPVKGDYPRSPAIEVAGRVYRGAFYEQVYGSRKDIWIRTASKHFNPADYPDAELRSDPKNRWGSMDPHMYHRFPLAKAKVRLNVVKPLFDEWVRRVDQRLLMLLKRELNFELHKLIKRGGNGR